MRKSNFRRVVLVVVLALAAFGGWTLYQNNQEDFDSVFNRATAAGKELTK